MKQLSIFGSTGSIGVNALKIAAQFPDRFTVRVLAAKDRVDLLAEQIGRFQPDMAVVVDEAAAERLRQCLPADATVKILSGEAGYRAAAVYGPVDTAVIAVVGAAGLMPTLAAIEAGKDIALATKEVLVMAGERVMAAAAQKGVSMMPIDSEHSAIFQCLAGSRRQDISHLVLTASGGPFRDLSAAAFPDVTPAEAVAHPNWQMGPKISVDSATLMNKGLEVIEAQHLFNVSVDHIQVVIHRQSIIHSMVAFRDGSVLAQLGIPDMKGAIAYALSCPERLPLNQPALEFAGLDGLTFQAPDLEKFPCLALAFDAGRTGGSLPAVLNGANEAAVQAFLAGRLSFDRIAAVVAEVMRRHPVTPSPTLEQIRAADQWSRRTAEDLILASAPMDG